MFEKRSEKRSPIELAASYGMGDDPRPEREAKIFNMSSGGFCLTSDSKLKVGEEIQLAVDLDTTDEVMVSVKVIWVKKNDYNKQYTIGVQIVEKEGPEFDRFMDFYNGLV
ncbi:MAG: PilZ domain-containing protein [Candidatus Omnitrophica bacterium]|nr:PilZ domain-containing protein [Candidatus Omnitrophota bacterium]